MPPPGACGNLPLLRTCDLLVWCVAQGKYLIELPVDAKAPAGWVKICSTKKANRFLPPAVKDGIARLEQAQERRIKSCKVSCFRWMSSPVALSGNPPWACFCVFLSLPADTTMLTAVGLCCIARMHGQLSLASSPSITAHSELQQLPWRKSMLCLPSVRYVHTQCTTHS